MHAAEPDCGLCLVVLLYQICLETNCLNSFELSSARLHWNSEDLPVVASQLSLLALDSDEQTVGRGVFEPFPDVATISCSIVLVVFGTVQS